jgi:glycosyltransferase involved in cell wall biosynthesis
MVDGFEAAKAMARASVASGFMPNSTPSPLIQLRVLHVVDSLEFGGLERVTTDLAKAQKAAGHHVSVFSIQSTQGLKQELIDAGIEVIEGHKSGTLDRRVLLALRQTLQTQGIDLVHAHNFVPNYHAALAVMGLRHRPALVCTCHDMGTRLSQRKLRWLFRWSLRRTAHVAMVGQQVHARYVGSGMVKPERASTVLNGIPVDRFTNSPERRARARLALGLPTEALVVGCVGRLVALKNHHRMLETMPALLKRHPHLKLVVVGDGERGTALVEQVQALGLGDSVLLTGQRRDVADLLPAFDVFALPSQTEGLSIALLEACATGLAVVASRVGGNPEIIHDDETGLLVPPDDNGALEQAIGTLLDDAPLRHALGQGAATWVQSHASVAALEAAYLRCYEQALGCL